MRFIALSILLPIAAGAALAAQPLPDSGWHHPMRGERPDFAKIRARHADDIALLIGLRANQRPALDAFLATMEPPHREGPMGEPGKGGPDGQDHGGRGQDGPPPPPPGDAPDESFTARLDHMAAHLDARDTEEKQRIQAARTFYAGLDVDQQHRFEALERLGHGHFGRHGGHDGPKGPAGPGGPPPGEG